MLQAIQSTKYPSYYKMPPATLGIIQAPWRIGHRVWGQKSTIEFLINLGWWWAFSWNPYDGSVDSTICFGDISPEGGAKPKPGDPVGDHSTHKTGLDIDIFFMRNDGKPEKTAINNTSSYSLEQNIRLGKMIRQIAQKRNLFIPPNFFYGNDMKVQAEVPGLTTYVGHDDHFHVNLVPPNMMPKRK